MNLRRGFNRFSFAIVTLWLLFGVFAASSSGGISEAGLQFFLIPAALYGVVYWVVRGFMSDPA